MPAPEGMSTSSRVTVVQQSMPAAASSLQGLLSRCAQRCDPVQAAHSHPAPLPLGGRGGDVRCHLDQLVIAAYVEETEARLCLFRHASLSPLLYHLTANWGRVSHLTRGCELWHGRAACGLPAGLELLRKEVPAHESGPQAHSHLTEYICLGRWPVTVCVTSCWGSCVP